MQRCQAPAARLFHTARKAAKLVIDDLLDQASRIPGTISPQDAWKKAGEVLPGRWPGDPARVSVEADGNQVVVDVSPDGVKVEGHDLPQAGALWILEQAAPQAPAQAEGIFAQMLREGAPASFSLSDLVRVHQGRMCSMVWHEGLWAWQVADIKCADGSLLEIHLASRCDRPGSKAMVLLPGTVCQVLTLEEIEDEPGSTWVCLEERPGRAVGSWPLKERFVRLLLDPAGSPGLSRAPGAALPVLAQLLSPGQVRPA